MRDYKKIFTRAAVIFFLPFGFVLSIIYVIIAFLTGGKEEAKKHVKDIKKIKKRIKKHSKAIKKELKKPKKGKTKTCKICKKR